MYRVALETRGDSRFYASTKDATLVIDTQGQGANPGDALLAGLCGCVGFYAREYLIKEAKVTSPSFSIDAEAAPTPDGGRLASATVWIDLGGLALDDAQRAALLSHAQKCRLLATLRSGCPIDVQLGRSKARVAPGPVARAS